MSKKVRSPFARKSVPLAGIVEHRNNAVLQAGAGAAAGEPDAGAEGAFASEIMRFELVYGRICRAAGCSIEADLAAFLDVPPAVVAEAVLRRRLPAGWITRLLVEHHISPLWVCYGRGPMLIPKELPAGDSVSGALLEGMLHQCEGIYQMMQMIRDMRRNDAPENHC